MNTKNFADRLIRFCTRCGSILALLTLVACTIAPFPSADLGPPSNPVSRPPQPTLPIPTDTMTNPTPNSPGPITPARQSRSTDAAPHRIQPAPF
ncbi:MAG: hypothetical protein HC795_10675 [Coleofasciculaceae cyanobacterium RL_1_1]|nr:hypothetical protein [Coleofasciculaceae cyanobacterium RL_1_1]